MKPNFYTRLFFSTATAALVFGCTQETVLIERTGTSIGAEGGSLMSADGVAEINIPAGALAETTEVTIEVRDAQGMNGLVSRLYDFGPDGLVFDSASTLTIDVGSTTGDLVIAWTDPEQPEIIEGTRDGTVLSAELEHFSGYGAFNAAAACMSDADCLRGRVCDTNTNTCRRRTNPNTCMTDADCSRGQVCNARTSRCGAPSSNNCRSNAHCAMGQVCDPATATCISNTPSGCMSNADCPRGQRCDPATMQCTGNTNPTGCRSNADCATGQTCDPMTMTCVGNTNPNGCMSDADCPMGQRCDLNTNQCTTNTNPTNCRTNSDCPMGQVCDPATATCAQANGPIPCRSASDCPMGSTCNTRTNRCS